MRQRTWMRSQTIADAEGRFVLANIPKSGVYLHVDADDTFPTTFGVKDGVADLSTIDPAHLQVGVERKYHMRVTVTDPQLADRLSVEDGDGNAELIYIPTLKQGEGQRFARVVDGKSLVFAVKGRVRTVRIWGGTKQTGRIPVTPWFGSVLEVRH